MNCEKVQPVQQWNLRKNKIQDIQWSMFSKHVSSRKERSYNNFREKKNLKEPFYFYIIIHIGTTCKPKRFFLDIAKPLEEVDSAPSNGN